MSPALLVVFLFCQAQGTTPAPLDVTDLLRQWLNRPAAVDPPDEEQRTLVPTIGASPAAGVSFGVLLSQSRSAGPGVPLSVLTASASYSTAGRLVISARLDQQLGNAKWRLIGDWRLYDFTERTYGLGSDTTPATAIDAPLSWVRVHGTAYRNIARRLAVGGGYHLDLRRVESPDGAPAPLEKETVVASGLSADAIFDSRDNTINATRGIFARLSLQWFPQSLGSARTWQSVSIGGARVLASTRRPAPCGRALDNGVAHDGGSAVGTSIFRARAGICTGALPVAIRRDGFVDGAGSTARRSTASTCIVRGCSAPWPS